MQLSIFTEHGHSKRGMMQSPAFSEDVRNGRLATWTNRYWLRLLTFFCLTLPLQALSAEETGMTQLSPTAAEIVGIINAKQHPYLISANFANRSGDLDALYQLSNYELLWLGNDNTESNIQALLTVLENAATNGLNPANYDTEILQQKLPSALNNSNTVKEQAQYDTALSLSLLRFLHDLHYGRVNPQGINFNLKLREKKLLDLPLLIKTSLAQASVGQLPDQVEPKLKQYQQLKSALTTYRQLADRIPPLQLTFSHPIKPGETLAQADELTQFLIQTGDLPEQQEHGKTPSNHYLEKLVAAVKKFQHRHGLAADGVIGKSTVVELNTPIAHRVTQIELAMERLRWLPELSSGPSIIVNIPAFQLLAFDNINASQPEVTSMKVVVGKALKNQTPILMADMTYIDFMPYWNVPYNIVKEEIIPKLLQNPGFLNKENMELVSSSGVTGFSEATIGQLKQGTVRIRQRPGKKNALGRVKFLFPNKDDVYMHDTPANALFSRTRRDFSHGCVRVENPQELAEFVLKDQKGWDQDAIKEAMKSAKMERVMLKNPIPVLFFYVTAFFDQQNQLVFYPDIYGHDAVLLEALKKPEDLADHSLFASPAIPPVISQTDPIKTMEASK